MQRRVIALVAAVAAIFVGSIPASAAGAVSVTVHFTSNPLFAAQIPCAPIAGWNVINEDNGNGVMHFTANSNGFWATGTYEGDLMIQPAKNVVLDNNGNLLSYDVDGSRPTASGHVADWFGVSENPKVAIQHNAVNAQVTTIGGLSLHFHAIDNIQIVPPFVPPFTVKHQFSKFNCS